MLRFFRRDPEKPAAPPAAPPGPEATARLNEGIALVHQGRIAEAEKSVLRALELDPSNAHAHCAIAGIRSKEGRHAEARAHYEAAVALDPDMAAAHCDLGLVLLLLGEAAQARESLRRAVALEPGNAAYRTNLRVVSGQFVPMWHFSMLHDDERNQAYDRAIRHDTRPGDLVFEIGTGAGLLAMMAARAGAQRVVTCEAVEALAQKAVEVIASNGLAAAIHVIAKRSDQLRIPEDLPKRADLLVSEIVSTTLIGEGLLPSVEDAKARLLEPGARIIPRAAKILGRLAGSPALDKCMRVGNISGFDLGEFNEFSPLKVHGADAELTYTYFSEPFEIFEFDFLARSSFPEERKELRIRVTGSGLCAGVLQWFRLDLAPDAHYENAPGADGSVRRTGHWQQVLHTFAEPVRVEAGQVLRLAAAHNRSNLFLYLEADR